MNQKQVLAVASVVFAAFILFLALRKPSAPAVSSGDTPGLVKKWEFPVGGKIFGGLALSDDGTLYAAGDDGFVYALDSSGALQWKTYVGPTVNTPTVGPDGTVYVYNNNGRVIALNHSGIVRWNTTVYEGSTFDKNAGALGRDYFYAPAGGGLSAVRLSNGQVDWHSLWGAEQRGSVTLLADGTVLSPGRGRLNALNSRGELLWQCPVLTAEALKRNGGFPPPGQFFVSSGIAADNDRRLYAANGSSRMVAVGLDGSIKWEVKTDSTETNMSTPVIAADGTIFFGGADSIFYALDSFGSTKWTYRLRNPVHATPVLAQDGSIFVFSGRWLLTISPEGRLLSQVEAGSGAESSPTLAPDGTIYIATYDNKVIAYVGGHGGLMNSVWPKFQADLGNTGNPRSF